MSTTIVAFRRLLPKELPFQRPVRHGLADVFVGDAVGAIEIRQRLHNAQHLIIRPRRNR